MSGPRLEGIVSAVACHPRHSFSKPRQDQVKLLAGLGIEGDVHAGIYARHRYLARRQPRAPNLRQVHLIASEVFDLLWGQGYTVSPGDLGENVTTVGLDLERFPVGTLLYLGASVIVELTGLKTPCVLIDRFKGGLKQNLSTKASSHLIDVG